ncbi:MAG: hypothetical protein ACREI5_08005 [Candidatus Methylomirabilales bacterium]
MVQGSWFRVLQLTCDGKLLWFSRQTSDFGEPFDVLRAVSLVEPLSRAVIGDRKGRCQ